MFIRKATALPLCRATDSHWKKNIVSLSGVLISHAPDDLPDQFNGRLAPSACLPSGMKQKNVCETDSTPYSADLLVDALLAAAPGSRTVLAYVRLGV